MKPALILAGLALLLFAWMFRYEVSGQVGFGSDATVRPVMLDRWTGTTYVYYMNPAELKYMGGWAEIEQGTAWKKP